MEIMEKFAVDLDKVLDDFEFSEDRAEQIAAARKHSSSSEPDLPHGKRSSIPSQSSEITLSQYGNSAYASLHHINIGDAAPHASSSFPKNYDSCAGGEINGPSYSRLQLLNQLKGADLSSHQVDSERRDGMPLVTGLNNSNSRVLEPGAEHIGLDIRNSEEALAVSEPCTLSSDASTSGGITGRDKVLDEKPDLLGSVASDILCEKTLTAFNELSGTPVLKDELESRQFYEINCEVPQSAAGNILHAENALPDVTVSSQCVYRQTAHKPSCDLIRDDSPCGHHGSLELKSKPIGVVVPLEDTSAEAVGCQSEVSDTPVGFSMPVDISDTELQAELEQLEEETEDSKGIQHESEAVNASKTVHERDMPQHVHNITKDSSISASDECTSGIPSMSTALSIPCRPAVDELSVGAATSEQSQTEVKAAELSTEISKSMDSGTHENLTSECSAADQATNVAAVVSRDVEKHTRESSHQLHSKVPEVPALSETSESPSSDFADASSEQSEGTAQGQGKVRDTDSMSFESRPKAPARIQPVTGLEACAQTQVAQQDTERFIVPGAMLSPASEGRDEGSALREGELRLNLVLEESPNTSVPEELSSDEASSSCVQSTSDGTEVGRGEDEEDADDSRPSRPQSLDIPVKIVLHQDGEDEETEESPPPPVNVGPPGATPADTVPSSGLLLPQTATTTTAASTGPPSSSSASSSSSSSPASSPPPLDPLALLPEEERNLGKVPPFWVPDSDAPNCMQCDLRFTVLKRRHHCRACGKVLCSKCCNTKARLEYLDNVEARVCHTCSAILGKVSSLEKAAASTPTADSSPGILATTLGRQPNPNNPMEYCSTIPPLQQAAGTLGQPPPSVMVPVGVLKREGSARSRTEPKQVMFSDGIRPGGDLTELDGSSDGRLPYRRSTRVTKRVGTPPGSHSSGNKTDRSPTIHALRSSCSDRARCLIPDGDGLPPVVLSTGAKGEFLFEENPDIGKLMDALKEESGPPVVFALSRNFFVLVKLLNLDCCVNHVCWCFTTKGMCCVGQDEIVVILECVPDEKSIPRDVFCHLMTVYEEAGKGNTVTEMGHTIFQGPFLGTRDHGGFLYIRPTYQCLHKLVLPPAPYLVAILLQKWETPWAKVFPIRLMLRLGAEFRYYPCPLVSVRNRKPVYCEIGHTIMNLLVDFRNFTYMLPSIRGFVIHMEDKQTSVLFPKNRYDQVVRALNNSNDHVFALGANFNVMADSHLVCIQNEDESYQTQAINIQNKPRKVTGASFVVFNGALKTSSGLAAKSSIVEDGLMVQIPPDTMQAMRLALRNMKDFTIGCGPAGSDSPDELVKLQWVDDDKSFNIGVKSPIDGSAMDGIPSIRVHNGTDYQGEAKFIRWTEVFLVQSDEGTGPGRCDPLDVSRLSASLARAACVALVPHLHVLSAAGLMQIGVRATVDAENVGYEAGSCGDKLPPAFMKSLDNELVPVIHKAASAAQESPVVLELIFHVMDQ